MSTFEDIICSQCNTKIDQALMLSCEHNLCMNCAAKNLSQQNPQLSNNKQYIVCELCGSKTEIDNQTSKEILSSVLNNLNLNPKILNPDNNQNINDSNFNLNNVNNNEIIINSIDYQNNNLNNLLIANSNIVNQKYLCKEHGEPLSYLCLDCMSKCICSECIVHGIHRNHDVLNIKKAYPLIFNKTQDLQKFVSEKINELNNKKMNLEQKKSNIDNINQKSKNDIKNAFQIIRIRLNEKEKEILEKVESTLKDNINEINTYIHVLQSKMASLNKIIDSLNAHLMRKDELTLINYYCDNKNNFLSQIELNEKNFIFNINAISDLKITIDKNSFDNMLIALNDLNFEINSFKGIDIINQFDNGKFLAQRNLYGLDFKNNLNGNNNINNNIPQKINKSKSKDKINQRKINSAKKLKQ